MAATLSHLMLWNRADLSGAWTWLKPSEIAKALKDWDWKFWTHDGKEQREKLYQESAGSTEIDPHYREMLKYPEASNS